MMALMRNLGGSIGISIAFTILTRRTQLHQERLSATATHFYQPFVHYMNQAGGFTRDNIVHMYGAIQIQATMLAYLDVFKIMGIGCLLVVGLIAMMRPVKRKPGEVMAH
jgi:DHA2 family multidrug resistance protein